MVHCNLATLLAQRNLKISKVYQDTGISRTTLTALAYNRALGIQFDTLDTLCTYLKISASDLLLHIPVDITWSREKYSESGATRYDTVIMTVKERGKEKSYSLCLETVSPADGTDQYHVRLSFAAPEDEPELPVSSTADAEECKMVIASLPVEFAADLCRNLIRDLSPVGLVENDHAEVIFETPFPGLGF